MTAERDSLRPGSHSQRVDAERGATWYIVNHYRQTLKVLDSLILFLILRSFGTG